jgi:hypothetical protein
MPATLRMEKAICLSFARSEIGRQATRAPIGGDVLGAGLISRGGIRVNGTRGQGVWE